LKRLLEKINRDLEDLPPPPSSAPLSEVLRLISGFTREVERQSEGIPGCDGLLHQVKQPQDEFRIAIRRTAPCFVPRFRQRPPQLSAVLTSTFVPQPAEKHARPPFLVGEEDPDEIGLNDGKKIFIDDVLETAEWCVLWSCGVNFNHSKPSDQGGHPRATKHLSFHSPEGVHRRFRREMERARAYAVRNYCREGKRGYFTHCRNPFRELHA
jgi:hypothetical protein